MAQENVALEADIPSKNLLPVERRSKMETYCDILSAISTGAQKPTHILYRANLSWTVMEKQLESLQCKGLVESFDNDGRKNYRLSDRGFKLLKQFLTVREDLKLTVRE